MRTDAAQSSRRLPSTVLVVALALLVLRLGVAGWRKGHPLQAYHGLVHWTDATEAISKARETGKPILYDFSAEWCGPCRKMTQEVFSDPAAARFVNEGYIAVAVTDRSREEGKNPAWIDDLQKKYGVRAFPTLVAASGLSGTASGNLEGYAGMEKTLQFLRQQLPKRGKS